MKCQRPSASEVDEPGGLTCLAMVRAPNRIHFKSNKDHHGNRTSHNPSQASTRTDPTSGHRDMPRITPTRRRKWASVRAGYLWVSIWGCFVLIKRRICSSPSSSCGGYTGMICEQGAWTGRQNGPWASRNGPQRSATGSLTRLRAARRPETLLATEGRQRASKTLLGGLGVGAPCCPT